MIEVSQAEGSLLLGGPVTLHTRMQELRDLYTYTAPEPHLDPDTFALIIPLRTLESELSEHALQVGGRVLYPKQETHLTVLNSPEGSLFRELARERSQIPEHLVAQARDFDWSVTSQGVYYSVVAPEREPGREASIVEMVSCPGITRYYQALIIALHASDIDPTTRDRIIRELDIPAPHVTRYTSDPAGKAGIGINSADALGRGLSNRDDAQKGLIIRELDAEALL